MREIQAQAITELVAKLCVEANTYLPEGLKDCIRSARKTERDPLAQAVLGDVEENFTIAAQRGLDYRLGTLEPGKDADIVVTPESPFSATHVPSAVILEGKRVV